MSSDNIQREQQVADLPSVAALVRLLVSDRIELPQAFVEGRLVELTDDMVVIMAPARRPTPAEERHKRVVAGGPQELELR
jgi:hypothetical protein